MMPRQARTLVRALERLGLARWAYDLYEVFRAVGAPAGPAESDGLAVPPRRLRMSVAGTPDAAWFLESGRLTKHVIAQAFAAYGQPAGQATSVLDFGCGCGRVTRHWHQADDFLVHGTDVNARSISWCSKHLRFATFTRNELTPPLRLEDGRFDASYAISVFTHLPAELTLAWLGDLARVLRSGGLLVCSIHGRRYLERLTTSEREAFEAGRPVIRSKRVAGTNLCTAFHPASYVQTHFAEQFELLAHVEEGMTGTPHQDLVVMRKRTSPARPPLEQGVSTGAGSRRG
jgi:SAM-dependent methyltransferase